MPDETPRLAVAVEGRHAADVAEELDTLDASEAAQVIAALPLPVAIAVLDSGVLHDVSAILERITDRWAGQLLEGVGSVRRAQIFGTLRPSEGSRLRAALSPSARLSLDALARRDAPGLAQASLEAQDAIARAHRRRRHRRLRRTLLLVVALVVVGVVIASIAAAAADAQAAPVAAATVTTHPIDAVTDLPLIPVPATGDATRRGPRTLVLLMTGDGGWASLDRNIASDLAAQGLWVVGLDARAYLDTPRNPEVAARDVARALRHWAATWHADRLVLLGYSRGAEMAPFVANRLPADLKARLDLVAMIGLAPRANFTWHLIDMVHTVKRDSDLPVMPELERLRGTRMLCVYGADDHDADACAHAPLGLLHAVAHPGGHHFDGDHRGLAALVVDALAR